MRRLILLGTYVATMMVLALAFYEVTAKSPRLLGAPLPGWHACQRAERLTRWTRPTGILCLDRACHEAREALVFYGLRPGPAAPRVASRRSSTSRSSAR